MKKKKPTFEESKINAALLVEAIKPLLAGKHPATIGLALAELVALLISGHDEAMRDRIFVAHIASVLSVYPLAAELLRPPTHETRQ